MPVIRAGLLGCGNIGSIVARHRPRIDFVAVHDRIPERTERVAALLGAEPCASFRELIAADSGLVVEAASVQALRDHAEAILAAGKDLVALSVGALADAPFRDRLLQLARRAGRRIRVPSGALFGLDNLKVARLCGVDELILRTTKPPRSLDAGVSERALLFRGSAAESIERYPRNVNSAVAVSLAAGREVTVELWVDPSLSRIRHELLIRGGFGEARIRVDNVPSPDNPSTSYLAALSVLSLLDGLDAPLAVGT